MESKDADNATTSPQSEHQSEDEAESGEYEGERKSDANFGGLEGSEQAQAAALPTYQIRPPLSEKFKPMSAKEVIHNVLSDQLSTRVYDPKEARKWCKEIADTIRDKVKDLKFKRYKYIVNVVMGEHRGAGVKMGTRCIWDAEADSYAHDNFLNESIFCVAAVYAVYYY
ncbi:dynein light chain Tctex-type protein 2B [Neodiprion pinetum]|uniref:dynein light chain Tctex-type protein 2B n=1 Tax=Neodiprion pinetum TaxID=441929 RepID=UPI001EDE0FAD|nr:dynein light chain Tctex-type protein 2B-like [Neodiprion pinetum]